jgi:serine protease SohB
VLQLREEITVLLGELRDRDEVLLRLESSRRPGAQLRTRRQPAAAPARGGNHLTVAVDKVAASGGYMMACVGQRIIAAPFA